MTKIKVIFVRESEHNAGPRGLLNAIMEQAIEAKNSDRYREAFSEIGRITQNVDGTGSIYDIDGNEIELSIRTADPSPGMEDGCGLQLWRSIDRNLAAFALRKEDFSASTIIFSDCVGYDEALMFILNGLKRQFGQPGTYQCFDTVSGLFNLRRWYPLYADSLVPSGDPTPGDHFDRASEALTHSIDGRRLALARILHEAATALYIMADPEPELPFEIPET